LTSLLQTTTVTWKKKGRPIISFYECWSGSFSQLQHLPRGYQISPNYQSALDTKLLFLLLNTIKELKGYNFMPLAFLYKKEVPKSRNVLCFRENLGCDFSVVGRHWVLHLHSCVCIFLFPFMSMVAFPLTWIQDCITITYASWGSSAVPGI